MRDSIDAVERTNASKNRKLFPVQERHAKREILRRSEATIPLSSGDDCFCRFLA
jgi:hypothetical protein